MGIETGALVAALASAAVGAGTAAYQGRQQELAQRAQSDASDAARQQQEEQLNLAREQLKPDTSNKPKNPVSALFGQRGGGGGLFSGNPLPNIDMNALLGGGVELPGLGFALGRNRLLGQ